MEELRASIRQVHDELVAGGSQLQELVLKVVSVQVRLPPPPIGLREHRDAGCAPC